MKLKLCINVFNDKLFMMVIEKKEGGGNVNFSCMICLELIVKLRWLFCVYMFCEECL